MRAASFKRLLGARDNELISRPATWWFAGDARRPSNRSRCPDSERWNQYRPCPSEQKGRFARQCGRPYL